MATELVIAREQARSTLREEWYLCGHPAWPDPLRIWPSTQHNAQKVLRENPHPNAHLRLKLTSDSVRVDL